MPNDQYRTNIGYPKLFTVCQRTLRKSPRSRRRTTSPPGTPANPKPEAKTARRNRRWLQRWVGRHNLFNFAFQAWLDVGVAVVALLWLQRKRNPIWLATLEMVGHQLSSALPRIIFSLFPVADTNPPPWRFRVFRKFPLIAGQMVIEFGHKNSTRSLGRRPGPGNPGENRRVICADPKPSP